MREKPPSSGSVRKVGVESGVGAGDRTEAELLAKRLALQKTPRPKKKYRSGVTYGEGDNWLRDYAKFKHGDQRNSLLAKEEFEKVKSPIMFRGVSDRIFVQSNIDGDWVGQGDYGNGTYFAQGKSLIDAEEYAYGEYGDTKNGWIYVAKLREDAKIIDLKDLENMIFAEEEKHQALGKFPDDWDFRDNIGRYALEKGYDAVVMEGKDWTNGLHYLVVNQRTVIVDLRSIPGGAFQEKFAGKSSRELTKAIKDEYPELDDVEVDSWWLRGF